MRKKYFNVKYTIGYGGYEYIDSLLIDDAISEEDAKNKAEIIINAPAPLDENGEEIEGAFLRDGECASVFSAKEITKAQYNFLLRL